MRWISISLAAIPLLCAVCAHAAPDAPAGAAVYAREYRPDGFDHAGSIVAYLQNRTGTPLTVSELELDGATVGPVWPTDETFLKPDFRDEYIKVRNDQVAWYRARPNPVPPGELCEIVLRLSPAACDAPRHEVKVGFANGSSTSMSVDLKPAPFSLDYIGIEPGLEVLHIYAEKLAGRSHGLREAQAVVEIDGQPVPADIVNSSTRLTYAKVVLASPWEPASSHVVALRSESYTAAASIRAFPAPPPLGIMGNLSEDAARQYHNHLFDCHIAFVPGRESVFDALEAHNLVGCYLYYRRTRPDEKKNEPVYYNEPEAIRPFLERKSQWGYFLEDEPDGRYHSTALSGLSIARDVERAGQVCSSLDPTRPTYLQIDHGGFPRGVYDYGLVPDYICSHSYRVGSPEVVSSTRDHVEHLRAGSRPRPFYYLNCGYSTNGTREFQPDEMQLEVYAALGEGAKSFQWYPAHSDRGLLKHPRMWNAVGRMNGVLRQVLPLAAIGTPMDKPRVSNPAVTARGILCGDKAVMVVLVNEEFAASPEDFFLEPQRDVTVTFRLPRGITPAGATLVRFPEASEEVPIGVERSMVEFTLDVRAGAAVVIYTDDAVRRAMQSVHSACLERFEPNPIEQPAP